MADIYHENETVIASEISRIVPSRVGSVVVLRSTG